MKIFLFYMKNALVRKNKERVCLKRFCGSSCSNDKLNEKREQLRKHYVLIALRNTIDGIYMKSEDASSLISFVF